MAFETLSEGLLFPEGPVIYPDGSVIVVEMLRGTISRVWNGRHEVVATPGGGPNGAAVGPDGAIYVCNNGGFAWTRTAEGQLHITPLPADDYEGGRIERIDPASGKIERLYTHVDGHMLRGPNDIVFDRAGGFWFTDLGKEAKRTRDKSGIYYALSDGSSIQEVVYDGLTFNGIGLSPDESILYAADTLSARLWAFPLAAAGEVARDAYGRPAGRVVGQLPDSQLLDSLAVMESGNICVGTLGLSGTGGITTFTPEGAISFTPFPDPAVTNLCLGGQDRRTAYITLSMTGALIRAAWPEPGHSLNFAQY